MTFTKCPGVTKEGFPTRFTGQLSQKATLESTGTLAQKVNYAVKSSYLFGSPEASTGMPDAKTREQKPEAVVADVKKATVLILGY